MKRPLFAISCAVFVVLALPAAPSQASWQQYGNPVSSVINEQQHSRAIPDGSGGAFVVWEDDRISSSETDIYAQRLDAEGNPLWVVNGVAVCTASNVQIEPQLVSAGPGGVIISWTDYRLGSSNANIYAQRLSTGGIPQWTSNGILVCGAANDQYGSQVVADGKGGAIFTWMDKRADTLGDIYAQRLSAAGTGQWTSNGVAVCSEGSQQSDVRADSDGMGGIVMAWYDFRFPDADIFVNRLDDSGSVLWGNNGRDISGIIGTSELNPEIVGDDAGGAAVIWEDARSGDPDLYATILNASGISTTTPFAVAAEVDRQDDAEMIRDPATGDLIVVFVDRRSTATNDNDIYAQRFDTTGKMKWDYNGVALCTATFNQFSPNLALDDDGGVVFAWEDFRNSPAGGIYAQRLSTEGTRMWPNNGIQLSKLLLCRDPQVVADGAGGAFIAWMDHFTGDGDILAQRVELAHGYWGHPEPVISSVADVPGDQGGFVRVDWLPSDHDAAGLTEISHYSVWRATDAIAKTAGGGLTPQVTLDEVGAEFEGPAYRLSAAGDFYWEYMGEQSAHAFPGYSMAVATESDMTGTNPALHHFQVVAHTYSQYVVFPSIEASGASVDDLAPASAKTLAAVRAGETNVDLDWSPSGANEPDFLEYEVYRSSSPAVAIDPGNFLFVTADTMAVDTGAAATSPWYYVVVAKDVHGNLSDASNEAMVDVVTGVGNFQPTSLGLLSNWPNPFGSSGTQLRLRLPRAGEATLEVFDVRGRRVREIRQRFGEGVNRLEFDGRDAHGSELPSGVYLVRLKYGGESMSRKIIMQR